MSGWWRAAAAVAFFVVLMTVAGVRAGEAQQFAVAVLPAPVLNTADFRGVFGGCDGRTLRTDRQGQIRELEFIALPGTVFTVHETLRKGGAVILRVTTDDYPYSSTMGYYLDDRFVRRTDEEPAARARTLPPRAEIISRLLSARGSRYVWGGNVRDGLPVMLEFFPPAGKIDGEMERRWLLQGLDCSGLLYEATAGCIPRNTGALIGYGRGVPIAGLSAGEIRGLLEPLDLIVWQGHVIIVLDRERTIESRLSPDPAGKQRDGVMVRPLLAVLREIMAKRAPADYYPERKGEGKRAFVIRRWYPR